MAWLKWCQKYACYSKFHWSYVTVSGMCLFSPVNFQWNSQILNECLPNRTHKVTPSTIRPVPSPPKTPHGSQRSPPRPFWALCISCAKLLICLVTSQCFLHGTHWEISTLLWAVNHSTLPLIHSYHHYSIRRHSNTPCFYLITDIFTLFCFLLAKQSTHSPLNSTVLNVCVTWILTKHIIPPKIWIYEQINAPILTWNHSGV